MIPCYVNNQYIAHYGILENYTVISANWMFIRIILIHFKKKKLNVLITRCDVLQPKMK